jgi:capsular polysaccharide biosynthesis protein
MSFMKQVRESVEKGTPITYFGGQPQHPKPAPTPITSSPPPPVQKRDAKPDPDLKANDNVKKLIIDIEALIEQAKNLDGMSEQETLKFLSECQIAGAQSGYAFVAWPTAEKINDLRHAVMVLMRDCSVWSTIRLQETFREVKQLRSFKVQADHELKGLRKDVDELLKAATKPDTQGAPVQNTGSAKKDKAKTE